MHKVLLLSISLTFISISALAKDEEITASCADLGYNTPYDECTQDKGVPLICPVYDGGNEKPVICLKQSCRGYNLVDGKARYKDEISLNDLATDGRPIREHIELSDNGCTVGTGTEARTLYKVEKCKEGSLYQNGLCDVGCDTEQYPYDKHPGDEAGEVVDCKDSSRTIYGYKTCHTGWVGGWEATKNTANPTGRCDFASCKIQDYPYVKNPNINDAGDDVTRGETGVCWIGANPYFRYESCLDKDDDENVYTKSLGVCRKQCHFSNCTSEVVDAELSGYQFQYNEFTCTQDTTDCRVGDMAVFGGVEAGVIVHLPESKYDENKEENDRLLIIHPTKQNGKWADGDYYATGIGLSETKSKSYGKYNSKYILAYKAANGSNYHYPIFEATDAFAPDGCTTGSVCGAEEWYIPAIEELRNLYTNRYIIYNALNNGYFITSGSNSSTVYSGLYSKGINFDPTSPYTEGAWNKGNSLDYLRILSFYVR